MTKADRIEGACHCGKVRWRFDGAPGEATACNCTVCRRYGALWIYGYENEEVRVFGPTETYVRGEAIAFHFCPDCGCIAYWRGLKLRPDGRRRIGVNVRMAEPDTVAAIPIVHFDGLESWKDLPRDGKCVADQWF